MNSFEQDIFIEFIEMPQWDQLEREWLELETRSDSSFFTSWSWTGCWLACLPKNIRPKLLRAKIGEITFAMGLMVARNELRHNLMPVKSLNLHAIGDPFFDVNFIEYNGFLADRAMQSMVVPLMFEYLVLECGDWEELHLDGLTDASGFKLSGLGDLRIKRQQRIQHFVDLDEVRLSGGDYLSLLGQNTRYNIRRSIKEFSKQGQVSLTAANNMDEALDFLSGLKQLHQTYWQSRGLPGAFANPFFEIFHDRLIRTSFDFGKIQLIRISAGDRTFGYLYNFIHRGVVHNYQSGFDYTVCKRQYSPGLVSHSMVVNYNASQSHQAYDFMAGDAQYKRSLGTHSGEMEWIVLQRNLFKFRLEDNLRNAKRCLKSFLSNKFRSRQTEKSAENSL